MAGFRDSLRAGFRYGQNLRSGAAATAAGVAAGAPAATGRFANAGRKAFSYVKRHPYKSTAMGAMGLGAMSYGTGRSRRGPGVSKTPGRPTGMYKY